MMDRGQKMELIDEQYRINFNHALPLDVILAIAEKWERSGVPPQFIDDVAFELAVVTYQPLYNVAREVIRKAQRRRIQ